MKPISEVTVASDLPETLAPLRDLGLDLRWTWRRQTLDLGATVDLGVLGIEMSLLVHRVAHAPEPAADDLLAQELGAERPDAEDVRDVIGVPTLGEHRNADHAADVSAELALLANCVHYLAQQVLVGEFVGVSAGVALAVLGLELGDLKTGRLLEVIPERLAGFELSRVDQDAERPGDNGSAGARAGRKRPDDCRHAARP